MGAGAFNGCFSLTSISFPKLSEIKTWAFEGCINLISVNFPEALYIDPYAFDWNSETFQSVFSIYNPQLSSAVFPKVSYIGGDAFANCYNLKFISCPQVTSIESRAFY